MMTDTGVAVLESPPSLGVERRTLGSLYNFQPKQKMASQTADAHRFTLFGGSRGPGKSYWLRWYLLRRRIKLAKRGLRGTVGALFCETYNVLQDRQIAKIEREFPRWLGELKQSQEYGLAFHIFPTYGEGLVLLRNLDDPSKYEGAEFCDIAVDELARNPVTVFNVLRGSLRWPGLPMDECKFVATATPGGLGHAWVKSYWLDRAYPPELEARAPQFAFVAALPEDNVYLDASYWEELESLPPDLARAWRWGDWHIFSGQAFARWREDRHVRDLTAYFRLRFPPDGVLPQSWSRWTSVDWGRQAPFCGLSFTQEPESGRVFILRERYESGVADRDQARQMRELAPGVRTHYGDPSMWTKKTFQRRTFSTADEYAAEGLVLIPADNDRLTGKRKLDQLLEDLDDGEPGLVVDVSCLHFRRTFPALIYDEQHPEDVDRRGETHAYDAARYGLTPVNPRPVPRQAVDQALEAERSDVLKRAYERQQGVYNVLAGRDF